MRAFKLQSYIKSPNDEFDCEEFRYNHRFSAFQSFNTPSICLYHQYKEKDENFIRSFSIEKIYSFAQEHFDLARTIYEKYPENQMVILIYLVKNHLNINLYFFF
jgi:N-alpha-acetyltransferase 35, NatC auxiliary subunit